MLIAALASGCDTAPGRAHDCTCAYLTDTDVPGTQAVSVCAPDGKDPKGLASECVQGMGVGSVERCTCERAERACEVGACARPGGD